jgi:hypothetical protein
VNEYYLGRIPSPYDHRDWQLAHLLESAGSLRDQAVTELKATTVGYKNQFWTTPPSNTHWLLALALLAKIDAPAPPPATTDVIWSDADPVLDQGAFGTCVGNGWAQWGNTLPFDDRYTEKDARAIYYEATVLDGTPDNPDSPGGGQQGASVRSGAKAMQIRKRLAAYAFAASITEVRTFLRAHGPMVFGTTWKQDMFTPNASGYIAPTGADVGGHCYAAVGDLPLEDAILFQNSWGVGWGQNGRFKMKTADVATLLAQQGEAVATLELAA